MKTREDLKSAVWSAVGIIVFLSLGAWLISLDIKMTAEEFFSWTLLVGIGLTALIAVGNVLYGLYALVLLLLRKYAPTQHKED